MCILPFFTAIAHTEGCSAQCGAVVLFIYNKILNCLDYYFFFSLLLFRLLPFPHSLFKENLCCPQPLPLCSLKRWLSLSFGLMSLVVTKFVCIFNSYMFPLLFNCFVKDMASLDFCLISLTFFYKKMFSLLPMSMRLPCPMFFLNLIFF
jgi:hypothetical protein